MRRITAVLSWAILLPSLLSGAEPKDFIGTWELVPQKSSVIPLYRALSVEFSIKDGSITIAQKWGTRARDAFTDSVVLPLDGRTIPVPLQHQVAPTSVFLGIRNTLVGAT